MGTPVRSTVNLGVLSVVLDMPGHAYDVGTRFEERYRGLFNSTIPHVYKALDTLVEQQLVVGSEHPDGDVLGFKPSLRQPKRFYRASPDGAHTCRGWLDGAIPASDARREFWIRARSVRPGDPTAVLALLDRYEQAVLQSVGFVSGAGASALLDTLAREEQEAMVEGQLRWLALARTQVLHETAPTSRLP